MLDRISQPKQETQTIDDKKEEMEKMYVVVNAESDRQSIHDLKDKTIGFQTSSDRDAAAYIQAELSKSTTFEVYEALDYTTLLYNLSVDRVAGVGISQKYYDMMTTNDETLDDQLRIVHTYEREVQVSLVTKDITKEAFTIYLSGLDNVGSPDQQTRTDTNLLLVVNPRAKHIDMVSLPRDGYMPNSALSYQNDKLTHTGMYGVETSVETIENFFQIPVDYYARVSFNSLIQIVDIMDGLDVDVEISFCEQDENRSFKKEDLVCLEAGQQTLNGKEALAYSRHRKTVGYDNAGRQRAQRRIIQAMIDKLFSASALSYINELLDEAPNYIITNMPTSDVAKFISHELEDLGKWTISTVPSDTGAFDYQYVASLDPAEGPKSVYLFSKNEVQSLLNAYDGANKPLQMQDYSFDLSNLYENCPTVNQDPTIVWDEVVYMQ
jgi:LCP family protein required for cell wall assembly